MPDICLGNCIKCGKCARFPILDEFDNAAEIINPRNGYGIAIDMGTTAVVLALTDLQSGEVVLRHSFLNPQRRFGPDVISRIDAAGKGNLETLRELIREALSAGINKLLSQYEVKPEQAADISIAGNTVMTYLLLGFPCQSLGVVPFEPAYLMSPPYRSRELFSGCDVDCDVEIIPWLGAFAGGDITSGLAYSLFWAKKRFMLIDLGTNGEIALYDNGNLKVTATAAGPAFEQPVSTSKEAFAGASEVISTLAGMVKAGEINEQGVPENEDVFTRKQISDLQLAKSAIRCGVEILLEAGGLNPGDLEAVYLAGGIGRAMNIDDAITIGLLPNELKAISLPASNSSLAGAAALLTAPCRMRENINKLVSAAKEINLAAHPDFSDYFMRYIAFS